MSTEFIGTRECLQAFLVPIVPLAQSIHGKSKDNPADELTSRRQDSLPLEVLQIFSKFALPAIQRLGGWTKSCDHL